MRCNETITLDELAAAIGRPPEWLKRKWLDIHVRHGFPRKIALGWVWPRRLVEAWLAAGGAAAIPAPANENLPPLDPPAVDPIEAARQAAAARYGGRA